MLVTLVLIFLLAIAISKFIPVIRRMFRELERVGNNSSAILQRLNKSGGINQSGKRAYSTLVPKSNKTSSQGISSKPGALKPLSADEAKSENTFAIKDILSAVRINSVDVNAMSIVKDGIWWVNKIIRILPAIGLSVTGPRVRAIVVLLRKFATIGRTQGIKGLVIHLKACHVCLTQAIAGHMIKDVGALNCRVSRTNTGIPRLILAIDRSRIREDDFSIIRFYQTMFGMYRILSFEGKLKLKTITSPFTGNHSYIATEILPMVPVFIKAIEKNFSVAIPTKEIITWKGITKLIQVVPDMIGDLQRRYSELVPIWLAKSASGTHHEGIQVSSHPFLMARTAKTIADSDIAVDFNYFRKFFPVNSKFWNAYDSLVGIKEYFKPLFTLGKLGIKEEAAGKVRVFAMVPTWFQVLLNPIHDQIFAILRVIPQDGTFNQLKPLSRMRFYNQAFSLDLTAATDRLPLVIQTALLAELYKDGKLAISWANLLTQIEYIISNPKYGVREVLKYSVGQPMGALSSWAMLAFTHHFLVQVSAWRTGVVPVGTWFKDYAVLGDDLVIFNRVVASEYIRVIKNIGMEIGLHKSVLARSSNTLEFAKRIFHKGVDVSAVPFKEFFASLGGFGNILEFANKYKLGTLDIAKVLGFRFRALSKVNHGFSSLNYKLKQLKVAMSLPSSSEAVVPFLSLGSPKVSPWPINLEVFFKGFAQHEFRALLKTVSMRQQTLLNSLDGFFHNRDLMSDPLFKSVLSSKFLVLTSQSAVDWNWIPGPRSWVVHPNNPDQLIIEGPAEAKEVGLGFMILAEDVMTPVLVHGVPQRIPKDELDLLSAEEKDFDLNLDQQKEIRRGLAPLWDFQILPLRDKLRQSHVDVAQLLAKSTVDSTDMAKIFVDFLEVSRAAALLPTLPVSLARVNSPSRGSDPISIRLWKRWSKYIQGTVHGGLKLHNGTLVSTRTQQ